MRTINSTFAGMFLLAASVLTPGLSQAADAGSVTNVSGDVKIVRGGSQLPVAVGAGLQAKDEIRTGASGEIKWEMADGSKFGVPKDSRFEINEFSQKTSSSGGKAIFTFIKGAFRTVSGLVGKTAGDTYEMKTPVATMGIRGTDYSAVFKADGGKRHPDGLYAKVSKGKVVMKNDGGMVEVSAGQTAYVKDKNSKPVLIEGADEVFLAAGINPDGNFASAFASVNPDFSVSPPNTPPIVTPLVPPLTPPEVPASPS